ncbi:UdgX family uracil-DNA binding protein [Gymnodinialimonas sp. 57CJ19]|uniref:UdgX family uracil-DNA binding protein n=1 Tax=Gymnodinialimonas sp. 57CJ19 TaxID=3138498 RepID=UPI0031344A47
MHHVQIPTLGAAQAWRDAARDLLSAGVAPCDIVWGDHRAEPDLFAAQTALPQGQAPKVPRSFMSMAQTVVWHSDPERFARLYAFAWRLQSAPHLMSDRGDADLAHLRRLEKNVHRCQHKMKAFVRFRDITTPGANRRSFAAWFEPTHHTVEPTADFFVRRFSDMDWRILTPDVSAIFIGGELTFEEGHAKPDLPEDAGEQLWITYFRNIFNPARLMVSAMQSEMPKKYWKNLPEAASIPDMIAGAPARAREMALAAPTLPPARLPQVQAQLKAHQSAWDGPDGDLSAAISACTRCPLHCTATQAVLGQGPSDADLMIVGEQPGDQEDLTGQPFVGPAGQMFDTISAEVGLDRRAAYVTNAVKHFKFKPQGRRRLHQRPNTSEIEHCRWWLDAELASVNPKLTLALGSTAAHSLTGNGAGILSRRGQIETGRSGGPVFITLHPSYLLRATDPAAQKTAKAQFRDDLAQVAQLTALAKP